MYTKTTVKATRDQLQAKLNGIAAELGLTLKLGNASFLDNTITFKLEVVNTANGAQPGQDEFNRCCRLFGLDAEDFGKTFTRNGATLTICGCNPRASKMPILAKRADGTTFKFDEGVVNLLHPGRMTRTPFGWMLTSNVPASLANNIARHPVTRRPAGVGTDGEL